MSRPNETAFTAFSNTVYDMAGLGRLFDQINLIERSLFKDKQGMISEKARDYLTGNIIAVFEEVEKVGLEPQDDQGQLKFLRDLMTYLQNLPVVKVTVAFESTHSYVMKLNNQISGYLGKKCILEMIIDEDVIGGAIIEFNGKMSDQTLKIKLHDELVGLVEKSDAKIASGAA